MKSLILALLFCSNIVIASSPLYVPQVELDLQIGKSRNYGRASVLVPFAKDGNSLPFLNVFGLSDSLGASEGNIGLGYRRLYSDVIYGGYVFYDKRKSKLDNMYQQLTFGAEYLLQNFEARVNGYAPIGKSKNITANSHMERSLPGFDIELGGNLFSNLEGYVSFYYFGDKDVSMPGYRLRSVYSINPNIKLLGELSHDKIRGFNYFVGIKLRASLGSEKCLSGLEKKMVQNVVRDIDIVIDDKEETPNFILKDNVNVVSGVELLGEDISIIEEFIAELGKLKSYYSDSQEINRVYRRLSLKYHPDRKNGSDASFVSLIRVRDGLLQNSAHVINFVNEYHAARKIQSVYRGFAARASLETSGISLDSSGSNIMSNGRKVQVGKLSDGSHLIYDGSDLQVIQDSAINVVENHGLFQEGLQSGREVSFKSLVKNTKFVNGSLVPKGNLRGGMPGAAEDDGSSSSGHLSGGAAEESMSDEDAAWHGNAFTAKLQWAVDKIRLGVENDEDIMVFFAEWESRIASNAHIDNMVDFLNIRNEDDENIFHVAAQYGRVSVLQWIYDTWSSDEDRQAFLTEVNGYGDTISHLAACWGHVPVLLWVYDACSSDADRRSIVTQDDDEGNTISHLAAVGGHVSVLQWIYDNYSLAADRRALLTQLSFDDDGWTVAHFAARFGNVPVLQWIHDTYSSAADRRALLTQAAGNGMTISHMAAMNGHAHVLQWIYDNYSLAADRLALLTQVNGNGATIYHLAARFGNVPVLHWVLRKCSFADDPIPQGLSVVAEPEHTDVASLRAVLSAVPHTGGSAGKSTVHIIAEYLPQEAVLQMMGMSPSREIKELFVDSIMRNQARIFPNGMDAHDFARISNQSCLFDLASSQDGAIKFTAEVEQAKEGIKDLNLDDTRDDDIKKYAVIGGFVNATQQWQDKYNQLPEWVKESQAARDIANGFFLTLRNVYCARPLSDIRGSLENLMHHSAKLDLYDGFVPIVIDFANEYLSRARLNRQKIRFINFTRVISDLNAAIALNEEEAVSTYIDKSVDCLSVIDNWKKVLRNSNASDEIKHIIYERMAKETCVESGPSKRAKK